MRHGCILSHKFLRANCLRRNLDYILMTCLLTLYIWVWVCGRLDDYLADIHSNPQLLPLHGFMKRYAFLLSDVGPGHVTRFAKWDISRRDRAGIGNGLVQLNWPFLCFCHEKKCQGWPGSLKKMKKKNIEQILTQSLAGNQGQLSWAWTSQTQMHEWE